MNTDQIYQMRNFVADDILCIVGEEGRLGAGGFGVVQCAFHPSIGWVAVKCFRMTGGKSAKDYVVQQIQHELSALQKANHETILRVYGWAQWEGAIAMITELMPAGSLRLILGNSNVPLHPVLRLRMCKEVSDGTAFLHNFSPTKRLTHGDLKPDNILMSNDLHCKVGDFGSTRVVKHTGQTTTTTDGSGLKVQVTLVYAAPERLRKMSCRPKKEQDTFSYGIIVHGVLTRETPNQYSASEEKYLDGITRGDRPDTEAIDELEESLTTDEEKEIIQVLRSVMISCWQDKPTDRPDMRDVRDQLHQLMSKQKQSDVMRSVAEALDKMRIFSPVQSKDHSVPLSCFDSQTKKFEADGAIRPPQSVGTELSTAAESKIATTADASSDATGQPIKNKITDSSAAATIATTADVSSDATGQPVKSKKTDSSTAAATIATTVDVSSDATGQPIKSKITNSSTAAAATIATTVDVSSDATGQPVKSKKTDSSTAAAATIATTVDVSSDATGQPIKSKITNSSTAAAATIATTVDVSSDATGQPIKSKRTDSSAAATIATTVDVSSDATGQPIKSKKTDSSAAATIATTVDASSDFTAIDHKHRGTESSTPLATISSTVEVSPTELTGDRPPSTCSSPHKATKSLSPAISTSRDLSNRRNVSINVNQRKFVRNALEMKRKPTLKEVFTFSDRSRLPENVKKAPDLLEKYKSCIARGEMKEAKGLIYEIMSIIENEINADAQDMQDFATELWKRSRERESIPFFVASADAWKKEGEEGGFWAMWWCVRGMWLANKSLSSWSKHLVKDHVIPLMHDIRDWMESRISKNEMQVCEHMDKVLECIGKSWEMIDDLEAAEKIYVERLDRVKKTFGKEAETRWIYRHIMEDLDNLHKRMSGSGDATSCHKAMTGGLQNI